MSLSVGETRSGYSELVRAVRAADVAALFVEPRILRRVIKQDRRLTGIGFQAPHAQVYTIERERLLVIADRSELDLSPAAELPPRVILLPQPEDDETVATLTLVQAYHWYWRQLLHARIHIALDEQLASRTLTEEDVADRIRGLGATEFAEIRRVLVRDDYLTPNHSEVEAYVEFVAISCEILHFAPSERPFYFPAIRDWGPIDEMIGRDVPHEEWLWRTRPGEAQQYVERELDPIERRSLREDAAEAAAPTGRRDPRWQAQAVRAAQLGNHVRSAILRMRAARIAPEERARDARQAAQGELAELALQLEGMRGLSDADRDQWVAALSPLLEPAAAGFRRVEARLLYDLQKACLAHERGFFRFAWWPWLRSRGGEPLRRPLPLLQQVLVTKALRSAANRISTVRLGEEERRRLEALLQHIVERAEFGLRETIRPRIFAVLDSVGLVPQNAPETVARKKLVEELLDRIVERGFLNMGDLRDALSQNDLKLADLSGLVELVRGDRLLRADRHLSAALEGVYRPGPIYLRWPQRLSSIAFGTPTGRFLTQYVALPFGGSYIALEAIRHIVEQLTDPPAAASLAVAAPIEQEGPPPSFYGWVFFFGVVLLLILHRPRFRAQLIRASTKLLRLLKRVLIDLPSEVLRAPWVQRILHSQTWTILRNYVFRPAIATLLIFAVLRAADVVWTLNLAVQVFLAADLILNTPVGRYAEEWFTDVMVRAWHELRIRVLAALFHWVMDTFHQLLQWLERIIYTVDEWLRFRAGDPRSFVAVKLALGMLWGLVAYVVRIYVTLLIEPQVNPIKHFPVVTVSHKIMIPYIPALTKLLAAPLAPFLGGFMASTLAGANVLLLPGVFGFLVWELKENWRLYAANRPAHLVPIPVGRSGETVTGLLRPGIHSGTLPKLFSKLRRALHDVHRTEHGRAARKQLAALAVVDLSLRRFVCRTFLALLDETGFEAGRTLRVGAVRLATNRIDIELCDPAEDQGSLWLRFDDEAGWLTSVVLEPGWLCTLDAPAAAHFNAALSGFYKLAGVDLVHEQLRQTLGAAAPHFALARDGIVLMPDLASGPLIYSLRTTSRRLVPRRTANTPLQQPHPWPILDREAVVFADRPINWDAWVSTWGNGEADVAEPPPAAYPTVLPDFSALETNLA